MPRQARTGSTTPPHLPEPWADPKAVAALYRQINPYQDYSEADDEWREIRIPAGCSAEEVYRRLPSDLDREYAGYLTNTRIRYVGCASHGAWPPGTKLCTFHSHPTKIQLGDPDIPSPQDIRKFLMAQSKRAITVGRFKLWVWEKTEPTLDVAEKLWAWERDNLAKTAGKLQASDIWEKNAALIRVELRQIGVNVPDDPRRWAKVWPRMLETKLALKAEIYDRNA